MSNQYLLEIGLEEVPARFLLSLSEQLKTRLADYLTEQRIEFGAIHTYATPRRLAVIVDALADVQADVTEIAKGPAMKIAKDENGEWTKAALGFLRGQQATPEDSFVEEIKGVEYLHVNKFIKGQETVDILKNMPQVIKSMTFPVTMQWNEIETPFIRPIHWFVSLLNEEVVPFEYVGVQAGRTTRGHRFLGHEVAINHPASYTEQLKAEFVLADFNERQAIIKNQIESLAKEKNWIVPIDEELLEEVTSIVEWPTVFYGEFEEAYLKVPEQVLITAMKDHQRYFYALNQDNQLLPIFISVRNGNSDHLENVVKGNKKVLRARLEDALFFYEEDLKQDLAFYLNKLESVNEHFKLGSLADKQNRVADFIPVIAEAVQIDVKDQSTSVEAAKIYKYDLMTQTVGEFDELQGEIGYVYATHYGINEQVAVAIREQYLPKSSGGQLPTTDASKLLTLADKLDTLIHYFNVGLIPTGSNDPYALRRQAMGVVEILLSTDWKVDLLSILENHPLVKDNPELLNHLIEFFNARMSVVLEREQMDFDIIQSVVASNGLNFKLMVETAKALQAKKASEPERYRAIVEAISRVVNLGSQAESTHTEMVLAQTSSEKTLITYVQSLGLGNVIDTLQQLVTPIEQYFEENMVNDQDEQIKANRYATMGTLTQYVLDYLDPRVLISKF